MMRAATVLDALLWLLCGLAAIFDMWSMSRMIRIRQGQDLPSAMVFATIPIYWLRIAFITLPWTTQVVWIRIAEMFGFFLVYILVMIGIPRLVKRPSQK